MYRLYILKNWKIQDDHGTIFEMQFKVYDKYKK